MHSLTLCIVLLLAVVSQVHGQTCLDCAGETLDLCAHSLTGKNFIVESAAPPAFSGSWTTCKDFEAFVQTVWDDSGHTMNTDYFKGRLDTCDEGLFKHFYCTLSAMQIVSSCDLTRMPKPPCRDYCLYMKPRCFPGFTVADCYELPTHDCEPLPDLGRFIGATSSAAISATFGAGVGTAAASSVTNTVSTGGISGASGGVNTFISAASPWLLLLHLQFVALTSHLSTCLGPMYEEYAGGFDWVNLNVSPPWDVSPPSGSTTDDTESDCLPSAEEKIELIAGNFFATLMAFIGMIWLHLELIYWLYVRNGHAVPPNMQFPNYELLLALALFPGACNAIWTTFTVGNIGYIVLALLLMVGPICTMVFVGYFLYRNLIKKGKVKWKPADKDPNAGLEQKYDSMMNVEGDWEEEEVSRLYTPEFEYKNRYKQTESGVETVARVYQDPADQRGVPDGCSRVTVLMAYRTVKEEANDVLIGRIDLGANGGGYVWVTAKEMVDLFYFQNPHVKYVSVRFWESLYQWSTKKFTRLRGSTPEIVPIELIVSEEQLGGQFLDKYGHLWDGYHGNRFAGMWNLFELLHLFVSTMFIGTMSNTDGFVQSIILFIWWSFMTGAIAYNRPYLDQTENVKAVSTYAQEAIVLLIAVLGHREANVMSESITSICMLAVTGFTSLILLVDYYNQLREDSSVRNAMTFLLWLVSKAEAKPEEEEESGEGKEADGAKDEGDDIKWTLKSMNLDIEAVHDIMTATDYTRSSGDAEDGKRKRFDRSSDSSGEIDIHVEDYSDRSAMSGKPDNRDEEEEEEAKASKKGGKKGNKKK
eukprot:GFYU01023782.1.p1 GENE.GFYU01023782.1~~GFYU01023782.1.p1  ORF type:complete len:814 (-),score=232.48 GFYU01023782.1:59-2500(-)